MVRYDGRRMSLTLVIGTAVVVVGAIAGAIVMFGQRAHPLETTGAPATIPAGRPRPRASLGNGSGDGVTIRWYERVRSGLVLLLITVGIGMAIGAVVGAAALFVNLVIG